MWIINKIYGIELIFKILLLLKGYLFNFELVFKFNYKIIIVIDNVMLKSCFVFYRIIFVLLLLKSVYI